MAEAIGIQRRILSNLGEPKPEFERRGKIDEVLSFFFKFAFESTVIQSLRISTGRKREQSKDEAFPVPSNGEDRSRDLKLMTEEMQAKIEKMREDIDRTKQRHKAPPSKCLEMSNESFEAKIEKMQTDMDEAALRCKASSASLAEGLGPAKKSPDGGDAKGSDFPGKSGKRVFICSRL